MRRDPGRLRPGRIPGHLWQGRTRASTVTEPPVSSRRARVQRANRPAAALLQLARSKLAVLHTQRCPLVIEEVCRLHTDGQAAPRERTALHQRGPRSQEAAQPSREPLAIPPPRVSPSPLARPGAAEREPTSTSEHGTHGNQGITLDPRPSTVHRGAQCGRAAANLAGKACCTAMRGGNSRLRSGGDIAGIKK